MKALIDQKDYCDCCHKTLWFESKWDDYRKKYAYHVFTIEGDKILCWDCKRKFNIMDRLPMKKEFGCHPYDLIGKKDRKKK